MNTIRSMIGLEVSSARFDIISHDFLMTNVWNAWSFATLRHAICRLLFFCFVSIPIRYPSSFIIVKLFISHAFPLISRVDLSVLVVFFILYIPSSRRIIFIVRIRITRCQYIHNHFPYVTDYFRLQVWAVYEITSSSARTKTNKAKHGGVDTTISSVALGADYSNISLLRHLGLLQRSLCFS